MSKKSTELKVYDCVFSLGEACMCAGILRKLSLRRFSCPFDWIGGHTVPERIDMIIEGFPDFMRPDDWEYRGQRLEPEPCNIYFNKRTRMIFVHDFPLNVPVEESYPAVKEKYDRRTKNLVERIKKSQRVLIVYMELPKTECGVKEPEELRGVLNKANEYFAPAVIDLLYVRHDENMKDGETEVTQIDDNVLFCRCYNRKRTVNEVIPGNFENAKLLFENIRCRGGETGNVVYAFRLQLLKLKRFIIKRQLKNGKDVLQVLGIKLVQRTAEEKKNRRKENFSAKLKKHARKIKHLVYDRKLRDGKEVLVILGIRFVRSDG